MIERRLRRFAQHVLPRPVYDALRARYDALRARYVRARGPAPRPRWGNLRRLEPFSKAYGLDRGTPVDRYYLSTFFGREWSAVRGTVLEMERPEWTEKFGAATVDCLDIADIDATNVHANIVVDLCDPDSLPAKRYDCIIAPQTLQYLPDPVVAIRNFWQALTPTGSLLLSAPVVSRLDNGAGPDGDRWRFTPSGLRTLLAKALPEIEPVVVGYGNVLSAIAFLHGLSAEELSKAELEALDVRFPIVSCARVDRLG